MKHLIFYFCFASSLSYGINKELFLHALQEKTEQLKQTTHAKANTLFYQKGLIDLASVAAGSATQTILTSNVVIEWGITYLENVETTNPDIINALIKILKNATQENSVN